MLIVVNGRRVQEQCCVRKNKRQPASPMAIDKEAGDDRERKHTTFWSLEKCHWNCGVYEWRGNAVESANFGVCARTTEVIFIRFRVKYDRHR